MPSAARRSAPQRVPPSWRPASTNTSCDLRGSPSTSPRSRATRRRHQDDLRDSRLAVRASLRSPGRAQGAGLRIGLGQAAREAVARLAPHAVRRAAVDAIEVLDGRSSARRAASSSPATARAEGARRVRPAAPGLASPARRPVDAEGLRLPVVRLQVGVREGQAGETPDGASRTPVGLTRRAARAVDLVLPRRRSGRRGRTLRRRRRPSSSGL